MEVLSKHLFLHSPIKLFFRVLESAEYQNDDPYSLFCNSIFDVSLFFNESSVFEIAQHVEMLAAHIKNIAKDKTFCKKKNEWGSSFILACLQTFSKWSSKRLVAVGGTVLATVSKSHGRLFFQSTSLLYHTVIDLH